jgi:group I intron endonuclease
MGYIYMLKNKVNGKIYIGQTTRPIRKRLGEHETGESRKCRAIYNAIQYHGWDNFEKDWYECPCSW